MKLSVKLKDSLKYLKTDDLVGIIIFILILPIGIIYKIYLKISNKRLWLVAEGKNDARDNGFVFYEYVRTMHPNINAYYAIAKNSQSYNKVKKLQNIVEYGGFKHWVYYIAATKNISSQKAANPCPSLFYVLHNTRILNGHRIYLKHGVIMSDVAFVHYDVTKFELITCGAEPEYKYIINKFGYTPKNAVYTGLARFDKLWGVKVNKKQILIMPGWRSWLSREVNMLGDKQDFTNSNYFKTYQNLINNSDFIDYIEARDIVCYFLPHSNMQKFIDHFTTKSKNIHITTNKNADMQKLISESGLMISDYSSVVADFAYMKKPLIYYQFDLEEFREKQYSESYFDHDTMGFGPVIYSESDVVKNIKYYFDNSLIVQPKYTTNSERFFSLKDNRNCERIFNKIYMMDYVQVQKNYNKTVDKPEST